MSAVKLYLDLLSAPCRGILMFCKKAGVEHEIVKMSLLDGDHKKEPFTKISKVGTIPLIVDADFAINDSVTALRYLADTRDVVEDHWYPKDPKARARVDEYLHWQHLNTRLNGLNYFLERWLHPFVAKGPVDEEAVKEWEGKLDAVLDKIEAQWLEKGKKNFIAGGDKMSVADIFCVVELDQPTMTEFDVCKGRPVLGAYMKRVKAELGSAYDDASVEVARVTKEYGGTIPNGICDKRGPL